MPRSSLASSDRDRSAIAYAAARATAGRFILEGMLGWSDYRKDRAFHISAQGSTVDIAEEHRRNRANGAFGFVYRHQPGRLLRFACQEWTRPASLSTLSPVSVAGIVTDDQLAFPGGKQTRCRSQLEWEVGANTFLSLAAGGRIFATCIPSSMAF